ncbi:MAG: hypothetical protein K0R34_658 [Herbinix sp.]|jgi:hypothetical protein|nr:hypothetical protein [Herbinix sp.]
MSLIVADEEFSRGASRIRDMSDELLDIFALYSKIIDELTQKGICSKSVQNVLAEKVTTLSGYADLLSGITNRIVNETTSFITDIDEADSYLYD